MQRPQTPAWLIHNHTFDLRSTILSGEITNHTYSVAPEPGSDRVLYDVTYNEPTSIISSSGKAVTITEETVETFSTDSTYEICASKFHQSVVNQNITTVTTCHTKNVGTFSPQVIGTASANKQFVFNRQPASKKEHSLICDLVERSFCS